MGLEWAYRTSQDPRRLARRYLTTNSVFAAAVSAQLIRQRLLRRGEMPSQAFVPGDRWEVVDA